jgi:hypothetical protein
MEQNGCSIVSLSVLEEAAPSYYYLQAKFEAIFVIKDLWLAYS